MKICYAAGTPLAGVAELMARCVTEYTEHEACVLSKGPGKHAWYVRKPCKFRRFNVKDAKDCRKATEWADVIHCMANVGCRNLKVPDLLKKKVWCFQWHGAEIGGLRAAFQPSDYPHVKWIHIGQGWIERQQEYFDGFKQWGFKVVPNVIADDEIHRPVPWGKRTTDLVSFAPSNSKPGAVNKKGIPEVRRACKDRFKLDLIMACQFEECLKRKRRAVLGIDEVVTGMYHRSGLEYLAQGTPCIVGYNDKAERILKDATGCDSMPFIHATPGNLREVIDGFLSLPTDVQEENGKQARKWFEESYHPRIILKHHLEVYN
jgi:hypothetical protein